MNIVSSIAINLMSDSLFAPRKTGMTELGHAEFVRAAWKIPGVERSSPEILHAARPLWHFPSASGGGMQHVGSAQRCCQGGFD
jgi:hypothetical protein